MMKEQLARIGGLMQTPMGRLEGMALGVIGLCVLAIVVSVVLDFVLFHRRDSVRMRRRSVVDTASMALFFACFHLLIRFRMLEVAVPYSWIRIVLLVAGLALIVAGCLVNIAGRLELGRNWANQVTLYSDQTLVTDGVYGIVRHPLYASLVWMFFGAALVYANAGAFVANACVFVPFMYVRAKQEEAVLRSEFPQYGEYAERVGLFVPKF